MKSLEEIAKEIRDEENALNPKMTYFEIFLKLTGIKLRNRYLIYELIRNNPKLIIYIKESLYSNIDFINNCLKINSFCYLFLDFNLKINYNIVLNFLEYNKSFFKYIPSVLKNDEDFLIKIINDSDVFYRDLCYNKEIFSIINKNKKILVYYFIKIIKNDYNPNNNILSKLKTDKDFIKLLINIDYLTFNRIKENFFILNENDYIDLYLKNERINIPKKIKDNDEFWIRVIKQNKSYIKFLPDEFKNDLEFYNLLNNL